MVGNPGRTKINQLNLLDHAADLGNGIVKTGSFGGNRGDFALAFGGRFAQFAKGGIQAVQTLRRT